MIKKSLLFVTLLVSIGLSTAQQKPPISVNPDSRKEKQKSEKLPPCKACSVLVTSFKAGMDKTARNKHDGGDAAWEEERLGSYKTSELRLVEIQEMLCHDIVRGENQCHQLAEDYESHLEEWWRKQTEFPDLYAWLCIEKAKVCCPENHFGPDCEKCADCHGNGVCKGNGTRKGNGKCACDKSYDGEECLECSKGFYEAFKDENKLLCAPCHVACDDSGCSGPGLKGCKACRFGWVLENGGCVDIDECLTKRHPCRRNQFCVNNEGSFSCLDCDKSCDGCSGDGPDLCDKCADGFELRDGLCTDLTNEKRNQYATYVRYATYLGLTVATCIILQNSTFMAALVGLAVAIYISVSEYWLRTTPEPVSPSPKILDDFVTE